MDAPYEHIRIDHDALRQPDPRIARRVGRALGDARVVLDVGAGTGSCEPEGPHP